jgi:hypothetical protein
MHPEISPLLAAKGDWSWVFFAGVILVSALVQAISRRRQQAERAKASKPAPPKRDSRFRNEIEVFLEEVGRRQPGEGPGRSPARSGEAGPAMRSRPAPRPPAVPQAARPPEPPRRPQVEPDGTEPAPSRPSSPPGRGIANRKSPVSDDLGAQVRAHLAQYLDSSRFSQQIQADIGNAVERALRSHLGGSLAPPAADAVQPGAAHPIVALLHQPQGVRNAVLINEVLARPKSLRKS